MNDVEKIASLLLEKLYTTTELKQISVTLETLTLSASFKTKAKDIANDERLTNRLKKNQLLELLKDTGIPKLLDFFAACLDQGEFWIFGTDHFDYFDDLSQAFQRLTENVGIVNLVTAIELKPSDLVKFSKMLSTVFAKQVIIHLQVNPKLLGGAQIRMGNLVYDYSLKSKFSQFHRQWVSRLGKTVTLMEG